MLGPTILAILILIGFRALYLLKFKSKSRNSNSNARTLIVIGSGGHTTEMIKQLKTLSPNLYNPRLYVMAKTDTSSEHKILELEKNLQNLSESDYKIIKIPRSRNVSQSYITSIFTTTYSIIKSIPIVFRFKPDLILCNGPGTCIPICVIGFLFNVLLLLKTKIVFFESICRVKTLSLSGKILIHFADLMFVQWESLHKKYPKTVYIGRLV